MKLVDLQKYPIICIFYDAQADYDFGTINNDLI